MTRLTALASALVLTLTGCSSGTDGPPLFQQIALSGISLVTNGGRAPATPPQQLSRALLDTLDGAYLEVTLERNNQRAFLQINAQKNDPNPGQITVWRTEDNVSLAMRNGVLIATRGLGGNLLSSAVAVQDARPGPADGGQRVYVIATRDAKQRRLSMICELEDLGAKTLIIVERAHPTRHLRETCTSGPETGAPGRVVNEYWVDSRANTVWQSRQWAGPFIGYLATRQLTQ